MPISCTWAERRAGRCGLERAISLGFGFRGRFADPEPLKPGRELLTFCTLNILVSTPGLSRTFGVAVDEFVAAKNLLKQ